jgi:hypothetical protein
MMNHYAAEMLIKERIADWQREANGNRLVRSNPSPRLAPHPARRNGQAGPIGRTAGWPGPVGRLTGWLGQVRRVAQALARAT